MISQAPRRTPPTELLWSDQAARITSTARQPAYGSSEGSEASADTMLAKGSMCGGHDQSGDRTSVSL